MDPEIEDFLNDWARREIWHIAHPLPDEEIVRRIDATIQHPLYIRFQELVDKYIGLIRSGNQELDFLGKDKEEREVMFYLGLNEMMQAVSSPEIFRLFPEYRLGVDTTKFPVDLASTVKDMILVERQQQGNLEFYVLANKLIKDYTTDSDISNDVVTAFIHRLLENHEGIAKYMGRFTSIACTADPEIHFR